MIKTQDELNQKAQRYAQVFVSGDLVTADKMHLVEMNIKVILEDAVAPLLAEIEELKAELGRWEECAR